MYNKYSEELKNVDLIYLIACLVMSFMFYFEGVTTWYQSVPGSKTLGTWEVIRITMGLSRLIET